VPSYESAPSRTSGGGIPDGLLVGLLALLLGATVLVWSAAGLSGLLAHGSWPSGVAFTRTPPALRSLASNPADLAAAWPDAAPDTLPRPGLFWGILVGQIMVLLTLAAGVLTAVSRRRVLREARRAEAAARPEPKPEPEPASGSQPQVQARSEPRPRSGHDSGPRAAASAGAERPATGLSFPAGLHPRHTADPADALAAAEGAALVVTANPALWSETVGARGKLGPVHLYDPTHAADAPVRIRWSPERGCQDPDTARARAAALLTPVRSPAKIDATVHDAAETLLRCCLHAAAVAGQPFRQVHRWATSGSPTEAVRILRRNNSAASGSAGELEATLIAHPERRDVATELIRRALAALSQLHVRNACIAGRNDSLALESFVAETGTLYLVGESIEDPRRDPGVMPLLTAITASVVEHGRRMAVRSSAGRLDPPLTVILDSPATVAPLAELPALLSASEETGIHTYAYLRSMDQARIWWPELVRADGSTQAGRTSSIPQA
jgi:hypothetical protein